MVRRRHDDMRPPPECPGCGGPWNHLAEECCCALTMAEGVGPLVCTLDKGHADHEGELHRACDGEQIIAAWMDDDTVGTLSMELPAPQALVDYVIDSNIGAKVALEAIEAERAKMRPKISPSALTLLLAKREIRGSELHMLFKDVCSEDARRCACVIVALGLESFGPEVWDMIRIAARETRYRKTAGGFINPALIVDAEAIEAEVIRRLDLFFGDS